MIKNNFDDVYISLPQVWELNAACFPLKEAVVCGDRRDQYRSFTLRWAGKWQLQQPIDQLQRLYRHMFGRVIGQRIGEKRCHLRDGVGLIMLNCAP